MLRTVTRSLDFLEFLAAADHLRARHRDRNDLRPPNLMIIIAWKKDKTSPKRAPNQQRKKRSQGLEEVKAVIRARRRRRLAHRLSQSLVPCLALSPKAESGQAILSKHEGNRHRGRRAQKRTNITFKNLYGKCYTIRKQHCYGWRQRLLLPQMDQILYLHPLF